MHKEIGCFNVNINDGNLDHNTNRWYYGLEISEFNSKNKCKNIYFFYIRGHEDGNMKEETIIKNAIYEYFSKISISKIKDICKWERNTRFAITVPTPEFIKIS